MSRSPSAPLPVRIIIAGVLAGTVDIESASLITISSPLWICQVIAAGVLGRASFHDGHRSEVLGLGLQWFIGIAVATLYVLITIPSALRPLRRNWILGGLLAGAASFSVMNYLIVPHSALHLYQHFTLISFLQNFAAILLFGLIIAFIVRDGKSPSPR